MERMGGQVEEEVEEEEESVVEAEERARMEVAGCSDAPAVLCSCACCVSLKPALLVCAVCCVCALAASSFTCSTCNSCCLFSD